MTISEIKRAIAISVPGLVMVESEEDEDGRDCVVLTIGVPSDVVNRKEFRAAKQKAVDEKLAQIRKKTTTAIYTLFE